jgi:hypothetical protein
MVCMGRAQQSSCRLLLLLLLALPQLRSPLQ